MGYLVEKNRISLKVRIIVKIALILLTICFIWGNSMQPPAKSDVASNFVTDVINSVTGKMGLLLGMYFIRKVAHFTEFFVLGLLLSGLFIEIIVNLPNDLAQIYGYKKVMIMQAVLSLVLGLFVACVDETIQKFIEGRSSQISDVCIDGSGVIIAILILAVVKHFVHPAD